ncbi:MAG TPA: ROK family protein [Anaerolineales bacterium]|nr:ROK family protein [Anaerolineales bacterium]
MSMRKLALGIDLGGTNLRSGLVDPKGKLIEFFSQPIDPLLSGDQIVEAVVGQVKGLGSLSGISGVGIGLAANIIQGGILQRGLTTLAGLAGYPFLERLSGALGKPCLMDNDSILNLLGEVHFGAARGVDNVLLITLGTGIGSGLLLDGVIRHGAHSSGSEIGLTVVRESITGDYVPVENLVSPGALMQKLGEPGGQLFQFAFNRDEKAQSLIDEMFEYLGVVVANAHVLLDLELVLLSGGLARVGPVLRDGVLAAFTRTCPANYQFGLRIELGDLPVDAAGVIGAACLWFEQEGWLMRRRL